VQGFNCYGLKEDLLCDLTAPNGIFPSFRVHMQCFGINPPQALQFTATTSPNVYLLIISFHGSASILSTETGCGSGASSPVIRGNLHYTSPKLYVSPSQLGHCYNQHPNSTIKWVFANDGSDIFLITTPFLFVSSRSPPCIRYHSFTMRGYCVLQNEAVIKEDAEGSSIIYNWISAKLFLIQPPFVLCLCSCS